MTQSFLAGISVLRRLAPRMVILSLVVAALASATIHAQEKSAEDSRAGWVVIPVEEYRVLRAKAYPVEHEPEPVSPEATLTRVDYELNVLGDLATGQANLTVDVLKDGWVRVPIPTGLLVREARLDGKLVSLVPSGTGKSTNQLSALLSHAGRWILTLDIDVPILSATGDESLSLPSTESGITRASVELARQGIDLRVSGGLLAEKLENTGETKWQVYGRGNEPLSFTWRKKTEDHHAELPLRLRGSLTQLTSLGEDSTAISSEISIDVVQGAAPEVRIQLPENVTINQVGGAMIADWEMKNGELIVSFLEPVEHSARFIVSGEARLPKDGIVDVPLLRLLNVERDSGGVAVEILGAGEIKDQKAQGLEEADATDLGTTIASRQSPAMVAFRSRPGDAGAIRSLSVNIARYNQQAVLMANIEEARYQVLMTADGKELVQARYAIRNNQRNFVKVALPAGAALWSASLAGKPVRPGQAPDGSLLLPLEKSRGGEDAPAFEVEILYVTKSSAWQDKGNGKIVLPALDLPISRTGLLLYYPPAFKISPEPGVFRQQEYHNPASAALFPPSPEARGTLERLAGATGAGIGPAVTSLNGLPMPKEFDRLENYTALQNSDEKEKKDATQTLLESFKAKSMGGKVTGVLPVSVSFPAFGPSIFLVSELTSENQSPASAFNFQRDKKGGVR